MIKEGTRVVRGLDWKWSDQDGGEGHVGTVVKLGKSGNPDVPAMTALVHWDTSATSRCVYRLGKDVAFDLLVFDSAATGMIHKSVCCKGCHKFGITGARWLCLQCTDFNLCSTCYHGDQHDLEHEFLRIDSPSARAARVPARKDGVKIPAVGVFPGATVTRGPDWKWGDQDGGKEKQGMVLSATAWQGQDDRSAVKVKWDFGSENTYRFGYDGKVDVIAVKATGAGYYYKFHLPIAGVEPIERHFAPGEYVRITNDLETLRLIQSGLGPWNGDMSRHLGRMVKIVEVNDDGKLSVMLDEKHWVVHASCVEQAFVASEAAATSGNKEGDIVRVTSDVRELKRLQKGHGGFNQKMRDILDRKLKVLNVNSRGDLKVKHEGQSWLLNAEAVKPADMADSSDDSDDDSPAGGMKGLMAAAMMAALLQ